jgi:hypothetical protein
MKLGVVAGVFGATARPQGPDFRFPRDLLGRFRLALQKLYAGIITQPLPPELQRLVDLLKRRTPK